MRILRLLRIMPLLVTATFAPASVPAQHTGDAPTPATMAFISLLSGDINRAVDGLDWIDENWQPGFEPMALDIIQFTRDTERRIGIADLLSKKTGVDHGLRLLDWMEWWWAQERPAHASYGEFKSLLFGLIDPAFRTYFETGRAATIRLDEALWGGVRQDGIPPLRSPAMIDAAQASYLDDDNVIFGLVVDGDARAYPKRILAWHELFTDRIGGQPLAGVYCTLCGALIVYRTSHDGTEHELGTSGFLYRSNKLMYDRATQSLWNSMQGTPVVGPLVGQGIRLERLPVVTTTWGEWRRRHPDTRVLSLDTGHERDYSEGAAYREYFASDQLMFPVPLHDDRLASKAEVLALRDADGSAPLAIASDWLRAHPLHHDRVGNTDVVVLTDRSGAHRVYASDGRRFASWDGAATLTGDGGERWQVGEAALAGPRGEKLARLPAHRAFWFGWYGAYPDTRLVR